MVDGRFDGLSSERDALSLHFPLSDVRIRFRRQADKGQYCIPPHLSLIAAGIILAVSRLIDETAGVTYRVHSEDAGPVKQRPQARLNNRLPPAGAFYLSVRE
jgi:hypothetical protein